MSSRIACASAFFALLLTAHAAPAATDLTDTERRWLAGATTLPVYLYGMLRVGVTPEANAAATILLLVSIAAVTLSFVIADRRSRKA